MSRIALPEKTLQEAVASASLLMAQVAPQQGWSGSCLQAKTLQQTPASGSSLLTLNAFWQGEHTLASYSERRGHTTWRQVADAALTRRAKRSTELRRLAMAEGRVGCAREGLRCTAAGKGGRGGWEGSGGLRAVSVEEVAVN